MIRRFTATLLGTAAAMTLVGGVALAAPSAGQPVALAAMSAPLPAQPPGQPNPPHPNPPPGHPNPGGPNHPGPPPGHPGPPPGHPGPPPGHPVPPPHFPPPPPPHFLPGHDHPHPGWRYDPHWGWWPGVVTPDQCRDGHGHVNWNDHVCIGGRFDGFRVS